MNRWTGRLKKSGRQILLTVLVSCALIGWGELYPQFTLVKGTYAAFDGRTGREITDGLDGGRDYREILAADSSQIYYKSRLLSRLRTLQEQRREGYESGVR